MNLAKNLPHLQQMRSENGGGGGGKGGRIPIPDSLVEEATFINICISNGSLKCHVACRFRPHLVLGVRSSVGILALPLRPLYSTYNSNISVLSFLEGFPF